MTETVRLASGEEVLVREIVSTDASALLSYFAQFSELTRKRFGPHPFDQNTIHAICARLAADHCTRLAAFAGEECVAYCLLQPGLLKHDAQRLSAYGIDVSQFKYATYAPSVAEHYHGTGLAAAMFSQVEQKAKDHNTTHLILWGGVQQSNPRAVRFYEKMGFVKVGSFDLNGGDDDMLKALS